MRSELYYTRANEHLTHARCFARNKASVLNHLEETYEALFEANDAVIAKDVNDLWKKIYNHPAYDYSGEFILLESYISIKLKNIPEIVRPRKKVVGKKTAREEALTSEQLAPEIKDVAQILNELAAKSNRTLICYK